ncbi:phage tail protein [Halomonas sp. B23F22_10]|uniref:phage tail protein n=1 Tax=Halomonas sp. B23F22_10 TaxID=3459515 RepID=UPI00373EEFFA
MAHVPTVPNFAQFNFALGDTDAAITKQNGQNAALVTFGSELQQTMTTLNQDIDQVAQDRDAAAQSASEALTYRNETQEISEGGLPPKAGNAEGVLRVADDEQSYVLDKLLRFLIPAGAVMGFPFTNAPAGWLKCNGAAVSRSAYADLFAAIGTTFGAGDGSTTFSLPDYRGEFPRWLDDGRGIDSGRGIAEAQGDQNKAHDHGGSTDNDTHSHSGSTNNDTHNHSGYTNYGGEHDHDLDPNVTSEDNGSADGPSNDNDGTTVYRTEEGGRHRHYFTTYNDTHNHDLNINSNTHDHGISNDGGDEARPRNMPLLACIRY